MNKKQMGRKPKVPYEVQLRIFYDCLLETIVQPAGGNIF